MMKLQWYKVSNSISTYDLLDMAFTPVVLLARIYRYDRETFHAFVLISLDDKGIQGPRAFNNIRYAKDWCEEIIYDHKA